MNDLENRFRAASSQRPLVIFLDALDQLSDENNARNLMWLPKNLPEHVHLVVTTVSIEEEQHECFKVLKVRVHLKRNYTISYMLNPLARNIKHNVSHS